MPLNFPHVVTTREKLILAGLYLSKYGAVGLEKLGFESFKEAYNVIAYALGSRPASVKNYRDEFDPLFPNGRKGWHKRPIRDYCRRVFETYGGLDIEAFAGLTRSLVGYDSSVWSGVQDSVDQNEDAESSFARRVITGIAAEQYFLSVHANLPEFGKHEIEDTRQFGCGYDFRLHHKESHGFWAVEVKGLRQETGGISLTPKEYRVARDLGGRFFLFVVKNFHEKPFHEIYQDPLSGELLFKKTERIIVHVSWLTTL